MKTKLTIALCAGALVVAACANNELNLGTADDIIIKNRGDVATAAMVEPVVKDSPAAMPEAELMAPVEPSDVVEEITPVVMSEPENMVEQAIAAPTEKVAQAVEEVANIEPAAGVMIEPAAVASPAAAAPMAVMGEASELPEFETVKAPGSVDASVNAQAASVQAVIDQAQVTAANIVNEGQVAQEAVTVKQEAINAIPARVSPYIPTY